HYSRRKIDRLGGSRQAPKSTLTKSRQVKNGLLGRILPGVNVNGSFQGQNIRSTPETDNLPATHRRDQRTVPEFFTGMNIRQMNFDGWDANAGDSVAQGYAGM